MSSPPPTRSIVQALRVHPRVAYQGHFGDDDARERLLDALPPLLPFRGHYASALAIVDWDHALPSRQLTLRIYAYYDTTRFQAGEAAFDDRLDEIGERDRFPEFDVPDFSDLPADEAYEADLGEDGTLGPTRLTSHWRREIAPADSVAAVEVARGSAEFARIAQGASDRPRHLGDLEAVSWTPPCESGHPRWTLDVWFLLAFDGRMGSGRSMLVDIADRKVITVRDFNVRAGAG